MSADTLPPPLVQRLQSYADDADAHGKVFVPLGTVTLREIIAALAAKPPDAGDALCHPAATLLEVPRAPAARDEIEIRLNDDGTPDEVLAPRMHLEQMSDRHWWMAVYDGDPRTAGRVTVNFHAKGKIKAYVERESWGEPPPNEAGPGTSTATPPQDEKTAPGSGPPFACDSPVCGWPVCACDC